MRSAPPLTQVGGAGPEVRPQVPHELRADLAVSPRQLPDVPADRAGAPRTNRAEVEVEARVPAV